MEIDAVRSIAQDKCIDPGSLSKTELIRSIQTQEGNFDCFASAVGGECDQSGCSWREDCFESARMGETS